MCRDGNVSRGTSYVAVKQRCKSHTTVDVQNSLERSYDGSFRITCDKSAVGLLVSGE